MLRWEVRTINLEYASCYSVKKLSSHLLSRTLMNKTCTFAVWGSNESDWT